MHFAQIAKDLREEAGLSQNALGLKLGISSSGIAHLELGERQPGSVTLLAYANFFGVSVDELLGRYEITPEERAAGARETIKRSITPIEDDMLYAFRAVGKKLGEKGQRAVIDVAESMAGIK